MLIDTYNLIYTRIPNPRNPRYICSLYKVKKELLVDKEIECVKERRSEREGEKKREIESERKRKQERNIDNETNRGKDTRKSGRRKIVSYSLQLMRYLQIYKIFIREL